jgi:hypothetical protein
MLLVADARFDTTAEIEATVTAAATHMSDSVLQVASDHFLLAAFHRSPCGVRFACRLSHALYFAVCGGGAGGKFNFGQRLHGAMMLVGCGLLVVGSCTMACVRFVLLLLPQVVCSLQLAACSLVACSSLLVAALSWLMAV